MPTGIPTGFEFIENLAKELSAKNLIFPTSLNITMRIRSALSDPNSSTDKIAHIVGAEPVLSAQLLRIANSAAMNSSGRSIVDLRAAISRMGYALVRNVAISVGMRQLSLSSPLGRMQPRIEELWQHSIQTASLSYVLAKKMTSINPDEAMLAGLLHDIGTFYILTRAKDFPDLFADEAVIKEIINNWHAEVGSAILEGWEIPKEIATAVADHAIIDRTHAAPADLTDVIIVADILSGEGMPENIDWENAPPAFGQLKLDSETCLKVIRDCDEKMKQISQALG